MAATSSFLYYTLQVFVPMSSSLQGYSTSHYSHYPGLDFEMYGLSSLQCQQVKFFFFCEVVENPSWVSPDGVELGHPMQLWNKFSSNHQKLNYNLNIFKTWVYTQFPSECKLNQGSLLAWSQNVGYISYLDTVSNVMRTFS